MKLLKYIVAPFLYLLSLLPIGFFYAFSDVILWLFYARISYRKAIVRENLQNAFPHMTKNEMDLIMRKFYAFLFEVMFEIYKMFSSRPAVADQLIELEGQEILEELYAQKKSVILVTGHLGNWELAGTRIANLNLHKFYAIYHPMTSSTFDRWFKNMRERQGIMLYTMHESARMMMKNREELTNTGFIADQVPVSKNEQWTTFLNQETRIFRGPGLLAKKLEHALVYLNVLRPKRGKYKMTLELITDQADKFSVDELNEMYTKRIEANIIQQPEIWLWSHRRWKVKRQVNN